MERKRHLVINLSLTYPIFIYRVVKPKPLAGCLDKRCTSTLSLSLGILSLKSDAFLQSVCSSEIPEQHKAMQVFGFLKELSKIKLCEKIPGMQGQMIWKDVAEKLHQTWRKWKGIIGRALLCLGGEAEFVWQSVFQET